MWRKIDSNQYAESWENVPQRGWRRERKYVERRRYFLWFPLVLVGIALLTWQITTWNPSFPLVLLGILCLIPWISDVP